MMTYITATNKKINHKNDHVKKYPMTHKKNDENIAKIRSFNLRFMMIPHFLKQHM